MRYLVKGDELNSLPSDCSGDFGEMFKGFTAPFMNSKKVFLKKSGVFGKRENDKAIFIVKNDKNNLYGGDLWNDQDIEFIANMDYMYCLSSWDWWISPEYNPEKYKIENLHHVENKYGYSVIFVKNNKKREAEFKRILIEEKFEIVELSRLYDRNNLELFLFYDYYRIFLPLKLAREVKRMKENIIKVNPSELYFMLRGGFLISELLNISDKNKNFIVPSKFNESVEGKYFVDDCLVMSRNLREMGVNVKSNFYLSCMDCVIPKEIYEKEFSNASLDLPVDLLSMFSCRIFEKNPFLIGMDYSKEGIVYYDNCVRNNFINNIRNLQHLPGLNSLIMKTANDLFEYEKKYNTNDLFEKIEILK